MPDTTQKIEEYVLTDTYTVSIYEQRFEGSVFSFYGFKINDEEIQGEAPTFAGAGDELGEVLRKDPNYPALSQSSNICPYCNGEGFITYEDDPGVDDCSFSHATTTFSDPCRCLENSVCPRCGSLLDASLHICLRCLWRIPE